MPRLQGYDVCKIIRQHFEESITVTGLQASLFAE